MSDEVKAKVKFICKILSLLPSIILFGERFIPFPENEIAGKIVLTICMVLLVIGWTATFVTGPIKVLKKMVKPVLAVWAFGTGIAFPVGILIGLAGAVFALGVVLFALAFIPFVYTIGN